MEDLGAKILSNINAAFRKDPKIDEFDILPVLESTQNKNPVVLVEHKLALEAWAAKLLYSYAYKKLMNWRMLASRPKTSEKEELLNLTRAVLMITADCSTAWNIRKEMICKFYLTMEDDLHLAELILTKHPKSPEIFTHRKWLLEQLQMERLEKCHISNPAATNRDLLTNRLHPHSLQLSPENSICSPDEVTVKLTGPQKCPAELLSVVEHEMEVCRCAAERYANNYNAWSHRIWTLQCLANCDKKILKKEFESSHRFVSTHVSDHSGFHYRQFILQQLHRQDAPTDNSQLINEEMELTKELILLYSGHEAIWYHRRFLIHLYLKDHTPTVCGSPADKRTRKKTKLEAAECDIVKSEKQFCNSIMKNQCESDWQKTIASRQEAWLDKLDF